MENKIVEFFKNLMEQEESENLTVAKALGVLKESDLDEETKVCIASSIEEHRSCEKERDKDEYSSDDEDIKVLTVSPYSGDYTLECEWCNTVVTDLECLLEE